MHFRDEYSFIHGLMLNTKRTKSKQSRCRERKKLFGQLKPFIKTEQQQVNRWRNSHSFWKHSCFLDHVIFCVDHILSDMRLFLQNTSLYMAIFRFSLSRTNVCGRCEDGKTQSVLTNQTSHCQSSPSSPVLWNPQEAVGRANWWLMKRIYSYIHWAY